MFEPPLFKRYGLRVRRPSQEIEPQEVLMDKLAQEQAKRSEYSSHEKLEVPLSQFMLKGLYGFFVVLVLVFVGKTLYLQAFSRAELQEMAENNAVRSIPLLAERGIIYDSSLEQLVFNRPSFDFVCDKRDLPQGRFEREAILQKLASISSLSYKELKEQFDLALGPKILLVENISHEELILFDTQKETLPGCMVQENTIREYAQEFNFAHLLGYTAKISPEELQQTGSDYSVFDQVGKVGVENSYEPVLRGTPGKILQERDSLGQIVQDGERIEPEPGQGLVLWLSSGLQKQIVESFQETFQRTGTKKAVAVALDPRNGGILALVSLPSFNANEFSEGISQEQWDSIQKDPASPLFNRAMSGIGYPTGSVIKPIIALAALEGGVITERTNIFSPLEICIRNPYTEQDECFPDWKYHGNSDVKRAIAESVNTFFYIIGGGYEGFSGLGPTKIKAYLERFGWGRKTQVDLPGEGKGILPTLDENWRLGDTYHLAIGQGPFAVTPLQVASAFAAIANKGTLFEPRAAQRIVDANKETIQIIEPAIIAESVVVQEHIEIVRQGMRQAVTNGSATGWLDGLPVRVAAKTGTAQIGRKDWDGKDLLYSWTVAFAPYENPEIVLVVLVEDVREGNIATLPVARDVLQWYFSE